MPNIINLDLVKSVEESSHQSEEEPPVEKRPCPESGIWKTFSDMLEEAGVNVSNSCNLQVDTFLAEQLIESRREIRVATVGGLATTTDFHPWLRSHANTFQLHLHQWLQKDCSLGLEIFMMRRGAG